MKKSILVAVSLLAVMATGAEPGEGELLLGRLEWLPESWSEPRIAANSGSSGGVSFAPSVPVLKQHQTGIRMKGKSTHVKPHPLPLQMVGPNAAVTDKEGITHAIKHQGRYKVNGEKCVAVGAKDGKIYFWALVTKRFFTAPDVGNYGPAEKPGEPAAKADDSPAEKPGDPAAKPEPAAKPSDDSAAEPGDPPRKDQAGQ